MPRARLGGMDTEIMCEWPVDLNCLPDDVADKDPALLQASVDTAVAVLWGLTGRRLGVCPEIFNVPGPGVCRPCSPTLFAGKWYNTDITQNCVRVELPAPVYAVSRVTDADGNELEFTFGGAGVAVVGDPARVEYLRGEPVPAGAASAVGRLATEIFLSCIKDRRCQLPYNVESLTRQGVSARFANGADYHDRGITGIPDVDLWVKSVNPYGNAEPAEVIG